MAQQGEITQFNTGGTHSQNPLGGIAMGQGASVEEGETAVSTPQGKFIFSDRIQITPQVANSLNLSKTWVGKTMADYSKKIDKQFDGREDSISTATKQRMLDKGAKEQEQIKAEQEALAQAQNANMEQGPEDMMNGQIPQGAEEYDENLQMFNGGPVPEDEEVSQSESGDIGGYIAAAGTALDLGKLAFGKASQDVSGLEASGRTQAVPMIGGALIKGADAGNKLVPGGLGAAVGATIGGLAGVAGLGKARKAEALNTQRFAVNTNRSLSDNYAYGGIIDDSKKKDIRKSGQSLVVNPIEELGHTIPRTIPTNMGKLQYSKSNDSEYNGARKDFVDWYSNPATLSKFAKNTGYDPARLHDMTSKATSIPSYKGDAYKQPPVGAKAIFNTPDVGGKKEEIIYHGGVGSGVIQHELTHAGAMANIIGPSLMRTLGSPKNQKLPSDINDPNFKSASNSAKEYLSIPEEAYGNFHEFRVNLGLKPGEKIDKNNLRARVKEKNLQNENFYSTFEDDKIVDAINTIAYNGNNNDNQYQAKNGGLLDQYKNTENMAGVRKKYGDGGNLIYGNETDPITNVQKDLGLEPGKWGLKSSAALLAYQKEKGLVADGKYGTETFKSMGLTPGGRQYVQGVDSALKPAGFAGVSKFDGVKVATKVPDEIVQKKASEKINISDKLGGALRYAAPAMNAFQLSQLKKPQGDRLDRLSDRYIPKYVDMSKQQNIVDQELSNTVNSIQNSGASQGANRAAILGAQLNKTKALSSAYAQAEATNAQQDSMAQQFNLGVNQTNLQQSNTEKENYDRDKGAYDTEKSKLLSAIGDDLGEIGKEERFKKMTKGMFGYDTNGKYVVNEDGTKSYIEGVKKKEAALGGLINRKYK